jgi:hypothetical protein
MSTFSFGIAPLAVLLLVTACVETPASQGELSSEGDTLEATSSQGLAEGRLSVQGTLCAGSNDFQLVLTPAASGSAAMLDSFEAVMPAHGHRSNPSSIAADATGYRIALPLTMSGMWRLTGGLSVAGVSDEITFDVDVP